MKQRIFKKDRTGLVNDVFSFRLDRSIPDSDEDKVWQLIEENESRGVGLREFVVDQILTAQRIQPHKPDRKTIISQLRREMQRLALMVEKLQNIQIVAVNREIDALDNTPSEVLENVIGMLDNMTEYGDE